MLPSKYSKRIVLRLDKAIGYVYFIDPDHPLATGAAGRVYYHRHVASVAIGRWVRPSEKIEGFSQAEEELADVVIRLLEYCHVHEFRIGEAILAKAAFNDRRAYKHGGKAF